MILSIILLAMIGFSISLYTYLTELKVKENPDYKPVCDISDRISCSKPMKSQYANIFFISNALVALAFYTSLIPFALVNATHLLVFLTGISCIASVGLAYLLYFKIKTLCLLCTAMYIINALLFYMSLQAW